MSLSTTQKVLVGAAVVGGAGLVYYFFLRKPKVAVMAPQSVQSAVNPNARAGSFSPGGSSPGALGGGGGGQAPSAIPTSSAYRPSGGTLYATTFGGSGGGPVDRGGISVPMPTVPPTSTNQVYTPNGYVSWGAGATYNPSTGYITNVSNSIVTLTTPNGPLNLNPGMSYNPNTGDLKW